jgi:hypothetical protein
MPRLRTLVPVALVVLSLAACGGTGTTAPVDPVGAAGGVAPAVAPVAPAEIVIERPPFLADLALVELLDPPVSGAGPAPVFRWRPVDGAATYRLAVLGPEGPRWGWEGPDPSIRYGAVEEAQRGPVIVPGSWWSVAAIDPIGDVLAVSDLRPVSPTGERGPAPVWLPGSGSAAATAAPAEAPATAPSAEPTAPAGPVTTETVQPCSLLTTDQVVATLGGEWSAPEESLYPNGKGGSCSWTFGSSPMGGGLSVSISKVEAYNPAGWNGESDPLLDGIGEQAYLTRSGMDRKVGFTRGQVSVLLSFDHGEIDFEAYAAVARLVDAALQ